MQYFGNCVDILFVNVGIVPAGVSPTASLLTGLSVHIPYAHPVTRVGGGSRSTHRPLRVVFAVFEVQSRVEPEIEVLHSPGPIRT